MNGDFIVYLINPNQDPETRAMQTIIAEQAQLCPTCKKTFEEHGGLYMVCPGCGRLRGIDWQRDLAHRARILVRTGTFFDRAIL